MRLRKWTCLRVSLVVVGLMYHLAAQADDFAPRNTPENDLIARALAREGNGATQLAPLTQRVWSESELLRLTDSYNNPDTKAIRRLVLGAQSPPAQAAAGVVLLTAEEEPRMAWRAVGVLSVNRSADFVFSLDTTRSLFEQRPAMPWTHVLQLRFYTALGEWRIGQSPLRWGGGYSGAMLLSDTPPPLPYISYRKDWHLGRRLGTWHFGQIASVFEEGGSRRYVMARRLRRELTPRWEISMAEAFKANKLPDGLVALVLPYYVYQHLYTWSRYKGQDEWFNYLADVQLVYRFGDQKMYLDLLLDDLQAPRWLTRFRYTTPRKAGILLGYHRLLPRNARLTVEVAHTDGTGGGVYTFKDPRNAWRYRDAVLGHPVGTNRDMLWIRLDMPIDMQAYAAVEYVSTRMANASPEVPVGKQWVVYLYRLLANRYVAGVRFQHDESREGSSTRWLLQVGYLF